MNRSVLGPSLAFVFVPIATVLILQDNAVVRTVVALPFVLFVPGYAITTALFPKHTLEGVERLLFSIGMSLALTVVGGIALSMIPGGLRVELWMMLLGGCTIVASLIGLFRYQEYRADDGGQTATHLHWREWPLIVLAVLIVTASIVVARTSTQQQQTSPFTQLWILPGDEADGQSIGIGVRSMELATTQYRLQLHLANQIVREWNVIVKPGETWETTLTLPLSTSEGDRIDAVLFLSTDPQTVYRHVSLWRRAVRSH